MIEDEHKDTYLSNLFQKGTMVVWKASRAVKNDIILGVYYNPLDQEEQVDEAYRQIGGASHSQALILTGNTSHHDVCSGTTRQDISSQGGSSVLMVTSTSK